MVNIEKNTSAFIINVIAFVHGLFACIVSTLILTMIISHLYKDRMKQESKIAFTLCGNIYLLIFIYSATLVSLNVHTLLGDLYGIDFDSAWCTFRGYFVFVMLGTLYMGFAIQVSDKSRPHEPSISLCRRFHDFSLGILSSMSYYLLNTPTASVLSAVYRSDVSPVCCELCVAVSTSCLARYYLSTKRTLLFNLVQECSCRSLECIQYLWHTTLLFIIYISSHHNIYSPTTE